MLRAEETREPCSQYPQGMRQSVLVMKMNVLQRIEAS